MKTILMAPTIPGGGWEDRKTVINLGPRPHWPDFIPWIGSES